MKLCRYVGVLALLVPLLLSESAFARKARTPLPSDSSNAYQNKPITAGATVWACAYGGNTRILCQLWEAGSTVAARRLQVVDPRLPSIVSGILNHPERLQGRISIPLHTDPFDFQLVGQLAEAVMCGNNNACGVLFAKSLLELPSLVESFEMARQSSTPSRQDDAELLAAVER